MALAVFEAEVKEWCDLILDEVLALQLYERCNISTSELTVAGLADEPFLSIGTDGDYATVACLKQALDFGLFVIAELFGYPCWLDKHFDEFPAQRKQVLDWRIVRGVKDAGAVALGARKGSHIKRMIFCCGGSELRKSLMDSSHTGDSPQTIYQAALLAKDTGRLATLRGSVCA